MNELLLGSIEANLGDATPRLNLVAKVFAKSTFTSVKHERPGARIVHVRITAEEAMRWGWDEFAACGFTRGQIVDLVDREIGSLCAAFLPGVKPVDIGVRCDLNNAIADSDDRVAIYVLIGHKDLFGPHGVLRESSDSVLRPDLLVRRAIEEAAHELRTIFDKYWVPIENMVVNKVTKHLL